MVFVKPIRTEEDYETALARVEEIFHVKLGTPEGDELNVLTDLIVIYEDKHYPIGPPKLIAYLEYMLEDCGMSEDDLVPLIGSKQKVTDMLAGKRDITMPMARALHKRLGIPAETLCRIRASPPMVRV